MGASVYLQFFTSVLRKVLVAHGAVLVHRGLTDDSTLQAVAGGLAEIVIAGLWEFWSLHREALYQRWLIVLGLNTMPTRDPNAVEALKSDARYYVKEGLRPHD